MHRLAALALAVFTACATEQARMGEYGYPVSGATRSYQRGVVVGAVIVAVIAWLVWRGHQKDQADREERQRLMRERLDQAAKEQAALERRVKNALDSRDAQPTVDTPLTWQRLRCPICDRNWDMRAPARPARTPLVTAHLDRIGNKCPGAGMRLRRVRELDQP